MKQKHKSRWRPTKNQVIQASKVAAVLIALLLASISIWALFDGSYVRAVIVILALLLILILIRIGYRYDWTGFGETTRPKSETQEEVQPRKTLWDWLGLLIVPLVLTMGGFAFAIQLDERQQKIENQRAESARQLEEQRAQDATLQAYLDQMSQLMLERSLRSSEEGSEVNTLARARTRTVLAQLNGHRKGNVVQFLYEASLINKERPVISLSQAGLRGTNLTGLNMRGVNLSEAELQEADLSGAELHEADLSFAKLQEADLSGAVLSDADRSSADLEEANLREGLLSGARLSDADLVGADLSNANLNDADLSGAYLTDGADLSNADLSNADLSGARLDDARGVTEKQLEEQAKSLEGATMPNGSVHD